MQHLGIKIRWFKNEPLAFRRLSVLKIFLSCLLCYILKVKHETLINPALVNILNICSLQNGHNHIYTWCFRTEGTKCQERKNKLGSVWRKHFPGAVVTRQIIKLKHMKGVIQNCLRKHVLICVHWHALFFI